MDDVMMSHSTCSLVMSLSVAIIVLDVALSLSLPFLLLSVSRFLCLFRFVCVYDFEVLGRWCMRRKMRRILVGQTTRCMVVSGAKLHTCDCVR